MKVKVVKDSVIHGQKIYKTDETFELNDDVAISLLERGYVEIEGGEEVAKALAEKGIETLNVPFEREQLEAMDYKELAQLAKDLGVKVSRKKDELVERILEFHADEEVAGETESDELPNTEMPE